MYHLRREARVNVDGQQTMSSLKNVKSKAHTPLESLETANITRSRSQLGALRASRKWGMHDLLQVLEAHVYAVSEQMCCTCCIKNTSVHQSTVGTQIDR